MAQALLFTDEELDGIIVEEYIKSITKKINDKKDPTAAEKLQIQAKLIKFYTICDQIGKNEKKKFEEDEEEKYEKNNLLVALGISGDLQLIMAKKGTKLVPPKQMQSKEFRKLVEDVKIDINEKQILEEMAKDRSYLIKQYGTITF